jgi:TRAP-type transport system periplasmic protein
VRIVTTRRRLAALIAAAPIAATTFRILPALGDTPKFKYKIGNDLAPNHPNTVRSQEAAKKIREASNGELVIDVYPNSALGTDTSMLGQMRSGALEFFAVSGDIFASMLPVADLPGLGYIFKNYDQVWAALDGDFGKYVTEKTTALNIHQVGKWSNLGFREVTTSTHPIRTIADFKGLKIRVPPSPVRLSLFKALGAAPASINFAEVYSALQTHVVDGQETPLVVTEDTKIYEVQKYCSMTRHCWSGTMMLANMAAWQRLGPKLQGIVTENLNDAALKSRDDVAKLDVAVRARLTKAGLIFNDPKPEPFQDELRKVGFYKEWHGRFGDAPWKLLEKYSGPLG